MRWLMKLLAPALFWLSYRLFRASLAKRSRKKHDFVMRLFRYAADHGSRSALSVYGHLLHFRGDGVQNKIQGGIYIQRAAELGDAKAQYQIARIYETGFESYFAASPDKALSFYQQAAQQSHPLAIKRLVEIYQQGLLGADEDSKQADYWFSQLPELTGR